jgi:hypothetical protein
MCFFYSNCFGFESLNKAREEIADGLEWAAEKIRPNAHPSIDNPYSKLATVICSKIDNWCDNPADVEQALHQLETDPQKINTVLTDLKDGQTEVLLTFVDNPLGTAQAYLGELTDFDKVNFDKIIAQQRKLRQVFVSFQDVTQVSFDTPPNTEDYPVLSFVYKVKNEFPQMPEKTTLQDENKLPFFTNNDVARAKFLNSVIEIGRDNKLIDEAWIIKVFKDLCQLTDEKTVYVFSDEENRLKKLCIIPNKNYPNQAQCESLNTEEKKEQAKAFLELRKNINEHLECLNR